jgi:hypothetical protein
VRCGLVCLLAMVGLFGLDALLFRTRLYPSYLEPDSSTGLFELILHREQAAQAANDDNMVVTLGNSRFAYSPRLSNDVAWQTGYVFRHAGVAGSDVRTWYYMLRDLDPTARRYRAIVFGVDDYEDEDELFNPNDDMRSLHYVVARLRWSDAWDFARSFDSRQLQWEAFRGALLKGLVYQSDFRAFLSDPLKRIQYVQLTRRGFERWTYGFVETDKSMAGLEIDWSNWSVKFPPGFDQDQRDTVRNSLMRKAAPQIGRMAGYRRLWFGRILDRYARSRTRLVFIRLPRGPILRPDHVIRTTSASIREFASRPNVLLSDEHAFDSLERPELFRDALHLNREGIARFSPMLAEKIAGMLGPSAQR